MQQGRLPIGVPTKGATDRCNRNRSHLGDIATDCGNWWGFKSCSVPELGMRDLTRRRHPTQNGYGSRKALTSQK